MHLHELSHGIKILRYMLPFHHPHTLLEIMLQVSQSVFQPSNHTNKGRGKKNLRINMTQVRDGSRSNCPMNFKFKHLIKLEK